MSYAIFIPARLGSKRLPDKPLRRVRGKPLVQWTFERAQESDAVEVRILCEDELLLTEVQKFTDCAICVPEGDCGTQRIANYLADDSSWDRIVNLQCDEPLIEISDLNRLGNSTDPAIATLAGSPLFGCDGDRHTVKAVIEKDSGQCYWFSRWYLGPGSYQHIGVYSFPAVFFSQPHPTSCLAEEASLEQLTWLEAGLGVYAFFTKATPLSINTEADLLQLEGLLCEAVD